MQKLVLYQTLRDRRNPETVESHGPYCCISEEAWLGKGFYFWDGDIDLAHWWGKTHCSDRYMVCQAIATKNERCYDLHGDMLHLKDFRETAAVLVSSGVAKAEEVLVSHVLAFRIENGQFPYDAIRAYGVHSFGEKFYLSIAGDKYLYFRPPGSHNAFLELRPAVQLCLLHAKALSLQMFSVVYPEEYVGNSDFA